MAFTGLVPREHSSGAVRRQGSITKAGNAHVRRVLVEAAWAYRHRPAVRGKLAVRQEGLPPELLAYSWKAQVRLHATYRKLAAAARREQGGGRRRARALRLRLGGDDGAHGRGLKVKGAMRAGGDAATPERSSSALCVADPACACLVGGRLRSDLKMCGPDPRISAWSNAEPMCRLLAAFPGLEEGAHRSGGVDKRISYQRTAR